MTKLESIEHKIFASEAPLDEIGQFGSALDTTKLNTKDVTTIQALPAYTKGWGSAIISDSNYPTMEEMNGVLNVMSYHTGYLYQEGMPAWRSDREYSATSIVKEPTGTKFFHSLKDGNIGNTLDNTEYWEELKLGGGGLELCDIGMALYVDETKGLRRYLNGQIVDINANTQAFLNRLLEIKNTNPEYFATEDNWQAEALLNIDGCVYKFVLNYSGETVVSVRLPKYPDYVEINAGGTLPVVGNGLALGLTNGTSNGGVLADSTSKLLVYSGSYGANVQNNLTGEGSGVGLGFFGVTTDPAKSGIQTTLKQTKLKMRYFIQIATGSETENNIINEIELNNPYSLFECKYADHELFNLSWLVSNGSYNGSNAVHPSAYQALLVENNAEVAIGSTVTLPNGIKYTKQGLSVKLSTETYTDYDFVLNTAEETFRLPLKTKLASGKAVVGNGMALGLSQNGDYGLANATLSTQQKLVPWTTAFGANAGTALNGGSAAPSNTTVGVTTDPTKSGIELSDSDLYLYYYVGETVQNANLIDAGRIGEQLATKTDMLQASGAGMPSSKYINLTLGVSGSTYTAPANGWFAFGKRASTVGQFFNVIYVSPASIPFWSDVSSGATGNILGHLVPVQKNQIITINYNAGGDVTVCRFIYAEGSK